MKAPDDTAIPLCRRHHVICWHGAIDPFRRWGKARRRAWADERIAETQARLGLSAAGVAVVREEAFPF